MRQETVHPEEKLGESFFSFIYSHVAICDEQKCSRLAPVLFILCSTVMQNDGRL